MIKKIFLISYISFCSWYSFSQKVYEIYKDDSISQYFKKLGKENGFYYDIINLKDSLPDGKYIFYNVSHKDSLSKNKNISIKGQYKNFRKDGEFVMTTYIFQKKRNRKDYQHICHFKDGKKDGVEKECNFYPALNHQLKVIRFYGEYLDGKKNGLFMYYESGNPTKVEIFDNDTLKQILLDNQKW